MRFKVPQNIDMEDRILGPLTMVQFIYAVIGGAACYATFMSGLPKILSYPLIATVALFVICLIFVKINERPFVNFLVSVFEFSAVPKQRVWRHQEMPDLRVEIYHIQKQTGPVFQSKQISHSDIQNLANRLDKTSSKG